MTREPAWYRALGAIPFVVLLAAWAVAPRVIDYPIYVLPGLPQIWDRLESLIEDRTLFTHIGGSLARLALGFIIGNAIAIPLGIAIALNRNVSETLRPLLTFLQSIAGIAWVPLAIIWFGIGIGAVIFVIANTIFFASLYNAVIGVETIPTALRRAVASHGGRGWRVFTNLILPGALIQIILGLRTSMAYGWRALVAGEMIAGTNGLGYMAMEAVRWYQTDTIILAMIVIGILWLVLDRVLFVTLERRTVARWGLLQR